MHCDANLCRSEIKHRGAGGGGDGELVMSGASARSLIESTLILFARFTGTRVALAAWAQVRLTRGAPGRVSRREVARGGVWATEELSTGRGHGRDTLTCEHSKSREGVSAAHSPLKANRLRSQTPQIKKTTEIEKKPLAAGFRTGPGGHAWQIAAMVAKGGIAPRAIVEANWVPAGCLTRLRRH
ncbi:unnamed protein product [Lampetra fluviatilis]